VLRPGFEPGSPARKAGILGPCICMFNLAIFGRRGRFSFLLPEPHTRASCNNSFCRFKFSPSRHTEKRKMLLLSQGQHYAPCFSTFSTSFTSVSLTRTLFCFEVKPEIISTFFLNSLESCFTSSLFTLPLTGVSRQNITSSSFSFILNCLDLGFTRISRIVPCGTCSSFMLTPHVQCSIRNIGDCFIQKSFL
jgi:hypothetical protein